MADRLPPGAPAGTDAPAGAAARAERRCRRRNGPGVRARPARRMIERDIALAEAEYTLRPVRRAGGMAPAADLAAAR